MAVKDIVIFSFFNVSAFDAFAMSGRAAGFIWSKEKNLRK